MRCHKKSVKKSERNNPVRKSLRVIKEKKATISKKEQFKELS